ncbi:unnamed protein product [Mesocestoides corti]|uniref:C2H2-type domain-containing protein n=1 Tax=Mesocestoides corti TaxID=53468 RepID=A0A3P6HDA2_MESCO|nr:unnamed protein product [Mesocestoides corti]
MNSVLGKKRQEFQVHLRNHYDYHCPKCNYTSRTEGRLRRHMESFHSAVPPENFSGKSGKPAGKLKFQRCKQSDRQLECTHCPFVTEYRHHLEYHIRNHLGSKPYKCTKCNYECVNKSMLNSHMKSHTNVYQYRCADCNYATKYCHSLKIHLTKQKHTQAVVLNVDGSLPEKGGRIMMRTDRETNPHPSPLPVAPPLSLISPLPLAIPQEIPSCDSQSTLAAMAAFLISMQQQAFPLSTSYFSLPEGPLGPDASFNSDDVLDLSAPKAEMKKECDESKAPLSTQNECPYCEIIFKNEVLFDLHKQLHNPEDPFLCMRCGVRSKDSVEFFNHLNKKEHGGTLSNSL